MRHRPNANLGKPHSTKTDVFYTFYKRPLPPLPPVLYDHVADFSKGLSKSAQAPVATKFNKIVRKSVENVKLTLKL